MLRTDFPKINKHTNYGNRKIFKCITRDVVTSRRIRRRGRVSLRRHRRKTGSRRRTARARRTGRRLFHVFGRRRIRVSAHRRAGSFRRRRGTVDTLRPGRLQPACETRNRHRRVNTTQVRSQTISSRRANIECWTYRSNDLFMFTISTLLLLSNALIFSFCLLPFRACGRISYAYPRVALRPSMRRSKNLYFEFGGEGYYHICRYISR